MSKDADNRSYQESVPRTDYDPSQETSLVLTGATAVGLGLIHPVIGIIAAGLAPYVANRLTELYARRAATITEELKGINLNLSTAFPEGPSSDINDKYNVKLDLLNETITNALGTSSHKKVRMLLHLLKFGLEATTKVDVLFAKRIVRTMARVDDLETILLASLAHIDQDVEGVAVIQLASHCGITDTNMIRSGLAVLASEGLVGEIGGRTDTYRVTDYGEAVLNEFRRSLKPTE